MNNLLILALAVLQLGDPVADAIGDGSLAPPTAPVYATTSNFDLQGVLLTEDPELTLHVTLGALDNPGALAFGFSHPVVEIYLDSAPGGAQSLLPGSGLRMPDGQGWESAIRLTGDEAYLVTAQEAGDPRDWPATPLTVSTDATTLIVRAPLPRPRQAELYAIAGVYDAFAPDAWRAISTTPTPWAFSSPTQTSPVVDVMAPTQAEQVRALRSGVLPRPRSATYGVGWLLLMLVGIVAATAGIVLRRRAGAARARGPAVVGPKVQVVPHRPGAAAAVVASVAASSGVDDGAPAGVDDGAPAGDELGELAAVEHHDGVGLVEDVGRADGVRLPEGVGRPDALEDGAATARAAASLAMEGAASPTTGEVEALVTTGSERSAADATPARDEPADLSGGESGQELATRAAAAPDGPAFRATEASAAAATGERRSPVPIVPLPETPPRRRAPMAGDGRAVAQGRGKGVGTAVDRPRGAAAGTAGDAGGVDEGWRSVLVDPHDSFLDEEEETALWPGPVEAAVERRQPNDGGAVAGVEPDAAEAAEPKKGPDPA